MPPREKRAWFLLLAFSLCARLLALGMRAVSHDESLHALYSWYWSNGLNYRHDPMMHGPLLFHLNGLVFTLLPVTDFTARLLPALTGTGCVAMLILFRRWLGAWGAFAAAVLVSLDPAHLYYSRYIRNDIYISLFTLMMVWAVLRHREDARPGRLIVLALGLGLSFACKEVCFIHGVTLGAGCLLFALTDTLRAHGPNIRAGLAHPLTQCAALILLLALPFTTGLLLPESTWSPPGSLEAGIETRTLRIGLGLQALTLLAGTGYFLWVKQWGGWIRAAGAFWMIQLALYTTLFTRFREGLASGLGGGLGYWLAQHDVERGSSDPAFYLTLLLLYAPVLLLGGLLALKRIREVPIAFCLFWAALHLGIYAWAGERMPWLLMHMSLPLCLLAGSILPGVFQRTGVRARILQAVMCLGLLQLAMNSLRVAGPNAEGPTEPLMYAHTGEGLKTALFIVEDHLARHPDTRVQLDPAFSWPTAWYFRETPAGHQKNEPGQLTPQTSVIFVPPGRREEFQDAGWSARMEVNLTTWPRQRYHRLTRDNVRNLFTNPGVRRKFLGYYLTRAQPEWGEHEYPGPNRFLLMTRTP